MGDAIKIVTYIINGFIILISLFLIFLYIKSKEFHQYQCYNIIILSIIIFLDNVLRLIPMDIYILRHIQAFLLSFFDKLILTIITSQAFIMYLGVCHTKFFYKKEKRIFFSTLIIGIIISIALTTLFIIVAYKEKGDGGITNYDNSSIYFYAIGTDCKTLSDTIFNGIFLFFNISFSIILIIFITRKRNDAALGIIEDLDYGHHNLKIVLMFIINSYMFVESYLIIYDIMPADFIDLTYLISCLLVDLYYTINKIIIKETMKIFCRKLYDKKYPVYKRRNTADINLEEDDDEDD